MKKHITPIALAILLVAVTTFTKAQNAPGNPLPPTVSKFNDIVEVHLNGIGTNGNGLTMGLNNVFAYRPTEFCSIGGGVGLESDGNYSLSMPLSADFRYYFNPSKYAAPFLNLNGGYEVALSYGGFNYGNTFLGANFGINIVLTNNMSLQLALGLKLEHYSGIFVSDIFSSYSNALSVPFTIGLSF